MASDHSYSVKSASRSGNESTPSHFEEFDDVICQFMKDQGIPGLAVTISYHGNVVYAQGYGLAGVNRRVTSSSRFRIASISKPLTAIGVMRLVELGHMTLDDKVFGSRGILKEFRPTGKGDKRILNITVRHLLQHSAGWDRDQAGDPVFYNLDAIDVKEGFVSAISDAFNIKLLKYMMKRKLQFAPGKRHAYSNFGYLVLGLVIENITGMRYETYMRNVFISLGLPRLRVGCTKRVLCDEDEVEYFNNREPSLLKSLFPNEGLVLPQYGSYSMENTGSYGGWVASVGDLITILHLLQSAMAEHSQEMTELDSAKNTKCSSWVPEITRNQATGAGSSKEGSQKSLPSRGRLKGKKKNCGQGDVDFGKDLDKQMHDNSDGDLRGLAKDCVVLQDYGISCAEVQTNAKDVQPVECPKTLLSDRTSGDSDVTSLSSDVLSLNSASSPCLMSCSDCQTYTSFGIPMLDNYYVIKSSNVGEGPSDVKDQLASSDNKEYSLPIRRVLRPDSVSQMLENPCYEDGKQWYGLGLDVQDSGLSYGHTGAMEGSCGTMMHHKSGLSWVLLMNAWSRDMDLDGLVKYALSTVKGYPLYFETKKDQNLYEVISEDGKEKVLLLVPHCELRIRIDDASLNNFTVTWISGCCVNSVSYFNMILRKSDTRWSIHIDISKNDICTIQKEEKKRKYFPYFIESYVLDDDISHCIIFKEDLESEKEMQILMLLQGEEYLKRKSEEPKYSVICQSVTPLREKLYVSALLERNDDDTSSWLQISAEEFLVEQKKQLKKGRDLSYVKFYSTGDDPFVSAVWTKVLVASDRFQRHGASKYGLLQELREAAGRNLRLQAFSSYVCEGVVNFAAVWKSSDCVPMS